MTTKEKLLDAGWVFDKPLDYSFEIFKKFQRRLIYESKTDTAVCHYTLFGGNMEKITDIDLFLNNESVLQEQTVGA